MWGVVTVDTSNGEVTDNVEYWLVTEAARAFAPGATVITNSDSSGVPLAACESGTGLCVAAATNQDGTTGLYVASATRSAVSFTFDDEGNGFTYPLRSSPTCATGAAEHRVDQRTEGGVARDSDSVINASHKG